MDASEDSPWPVLDNLVGRVLDTRRQVASAQATEAKLLADAVEFIADRTVELRRQGARRSRHVNTSDLPVREVALELGMAMRISDRTVQTRISEAYVLVKQFPRTFAAFLWRHHIRKHHTATPTRRPSDPVPPPTAAAPHRWLSSRRSAPTAGLVAAAGGVSKPQLLLPRNGSRSTVHDSRVPPHDRHDSRVPSSDDTAAYVPQNGSMFVSTETIAIVISAASLLLGLASGFGWMIHRTDTQLRAFRDDLRGEIHTVESNLSKGIESGDASLGERINTVESRLTERINTVESNLTTRITRLEHSVDGMRGELVEVKIAVARLEGPPRHLVTAR